MKIYLDDERQTPEGWSRTITAFGTIMQLKLGFLRGYEEVTHLSLDHDLGKPKHGTGYDVLLWIEEQVALHGYIPPEIYIHTANEGARVKMTLAVQQIKRLSE